MSVEPDGSVRHHVVVDLAQEQAFWAFTDLDRIKPREHNMLAADIAETVLEPRQGGRIYDRGIDGSECSWARVIAFEPPDRLVFSWNIGPTWQVETDPACSSEVEVRFFAERSGRTRVELEHRHLERHGQGWESVRDGVGHEQGWPLYLQRYQDLLAS